MNSNINNYEFDIFYEHSQEKENLAKNFLKGCTLAVVEDDVDMQKLIVKYLERYEIKQINFYSSAVEMLNVLDMNNHQTDIFLFDVNLPEGMSGIDLVRFLREKTDVDKPIILMSSDRHYLELTRKFFCQDPKVKFLQKAQLKDNLVNVARSIPN